MANRPVLILEGEGDKKAVPHLIREVSGYSVFPCPNPILKQSISKLNKPGELEKFVRYACSRPEGDSVLILLDSDETCAVEIVHVWIERISALNLEKKIGICFFVKEFEALFLSCLGDIMDQYPSYDWRQDYWNDEMDPEAPRDAKGMISNAMIKGRSYKETVDQVKFVEALDFPVVQRKCRSFRHFESTLEWLLSDMDALIYPVMGTNT